MGYCTNFAINVHHPGAKDVSNEVVEEVRDVLEEISGYSFDTNAERAYNPEGNHLFSSDRYKWYGYDVDVIELSKRYPHLVFTVYGEGEEPADIWMHKFFKGKHKRSDAIFTIPPIELEELK